MNGRQFNPGPTWKLQPDNTPLYSGIDWINSDYFQNTFKTCIFIANAWAGPFRSQSKKCDEAAGSICEFNKYPVAPAQPKPIPSVCNTQVINSIGTVNSKDIMGPDNKYIKTACYISTSRSYDESQKFCADNGMTLYKFNDKNR